jgi:hypothetical protein
LLSLIESMNANLDCRRVAAPPWLSPGTLALRSPDFPLAEKASDHPSSRSQSSLIVNVRIPFLPEFDSALWLR